MPSIGAGVGSNKTSTATAVAPLIRARRTPHTGLDLLTSKQKPRLEALFAGDDHVQVETTRGIYQKMIGAYREPDRAKGRSLMEAIIEAIAAVSPAP